MTKYLQENDVPLLERGHHGSRRGRRRRRGEANVPRGAAPEHRGAQDCGGTQAGERMDAKFGAKFGAGRSFSAQACFSLLFGVPLVRLPPPPAQGWSVRRLGEEVDERVERVPCYFLSPLGALSCLILARRTRKAWTKALLCSLCDD